MSQLQGHENWAYFYVMEAKNDIFSVFSSSWEIDLSKKNSRAHQKKFYDIWAQIFFSLEGQEGCKVAANILYGLELDCM